LGNLIVITGDSTARIDGLTIDGYGGAPLTSSGGDTFNRINTLQIAELDVRTVPQFIDDDADDRKYPALLGSIDMRQIEDRLRVHRMSTGLTLGVKRHSSPRVWSYELEVPSGAHSHSSSPVEVQVPNGSLRRGRVRVSNLSNLSHVWLVNTKASGEDKLDVLKWINPYTGVEENVPSGLISGNKAYEIRYDATVYGAAGLADANLDATTSYSEFDRELWVETTSGFTGGVVVLQLDYFPVENESGNHNDRDGAWLQRKSWA